ncbi:hypothetical protein [Demequina globuliformis]|uniref:hypothetical protein n=1 Tax=Demequina globuliformis TaxID=676202 RepID=UPI000784A84E|nr:hypothetical protein [Demequina globuliformis]
MRIKVKPRSDQWNADDFIGGPRTFTVSHVVEGVAEQPYDIHFSDGEGKAWRPPNGVLTLLIEAWTDETSTWKGRRVTLYRDPAVRFGKEQLGGVRVSHMSDLPGGKPFTAHVTVSRGKKGPMTVQPLTEPVSNPDKLPTVTPEQIAACDDLAELKALWESSNKSDEVSALIGARKAEIEAAQS